MLRHLYRCVLHLHPPAFRQRFGDEMLLIFDQQQRALGALRLLVDALVSLGRQWILRPEFWHDLSPVQEQPVSDGIPSFYTVAPFRPRSSAVIQGLILSTAVFCLTCFAIKYSWIRVLHISIPSVQFHNQLPIRPAAVATNYDASNPNSATKPQGSLQASDPSQTPPIQFEVLAPSREANAGGLENEPQADLQKKTTAPPRRLRTLREIVSPLQAYEGTYKVDSNGWIISVQSLDNRLVVSITDQPTRTFLQVSNGKFELNGRHECWIQFFSVSGSEGDSEIDQLVLVQNGREFTARRQ
jgi:hypothetical protein